MRQRIAVRLWLGTVFVLGALVLIFGLNLWTLMGSREATRLVASSRGVLVAAQELRSALQNAETGQRGFLLTGQDEYLEPYRAAVPVIAPRLALLEASTAHRPALSALVAQLRTAIEQKLVELDQTISARREAGLAAALKIVEEGRGRRLMEQARDAIAGILAQERQLVAEREALEEASTSRMLVVMSIGTPVVALALLLMSWRTISQVHRPLKRLIAGTVRIGRGDLAEELPVAGDEFGSLAQAFNRMTSRLREESRIREHTEYELQQLNATLLGQTTSLEGRNRVLELVNTMAQRLQTCRTDEEFTSVLRCFLPQLLGGCSGALYFLNNSRNLLERIAQWGEPGAAPPDTPGHLVPDDCWAIRRGGEHVHVPDRPDVPCAHVPHDVEAYRCCPLVAHGESVGLLYLQGAEREATLWVLEPQQLNVLVETIALTLTNHRLRETLRNQSIRDVLTGLFNRRYLDEAIELEFARATRGGDPVAVLMVDIDHFKAFNDTAGHDGGDAVLKQMGQLLTRQVRKSDIPCRYGGEEFAVVLPGTSLAGAMERAERIREAAEALTAHHGGQTLGPITVSIGVAAFPADGSQPDEVIAVADAALYRAKRNGRNRVEAPVPDPGRMAAAG